jgi:predicted transglutaminase-like cysteine proteinase
MPDAVNRYRQILFLGNVIFVVVFGAGMLCWLLVYGSAPHQAQYLSVAVLLDAAILAVLMLLERYQEILIDDFSARVADLADRAGIHQYERVGVAAASISVIMALIFLPSLLPIFLAGGFAFFVLLRMPKARPRLDLPPAIHAPQPDPLPIGAVPGEDDGATATAEFEEREYRWSLLLKYVTSTEVQLTAKIKLSAKLAQELKERNPHGQGNTLSDRELVSAYLGADGITADIFRVAEALRDITRKQEWPPIQEVACTLAFVQQAITFQKDLESAGIDEYWRFPLETLYWRVGDCEDSSLLTAAILKALSHKTVLLIYPHHVAVGVDAVNGFTMAEQQQLVNNTYLYCETTNEGWRVGDIPDQYLGVTPEVIEIR